MFVKGDLKNLGKKLKILVIDYKCSITIYSNLSKYINSRL